MIRGSKSRESSSASLKNTLIVIHAMRVSQTLKSSHSHTLTHTYVYITGRSKITITHISIYMTTKERRRHSSTVVIAVTYIATINIRNEPRGEGERENRAFIN